MYIIGAEIFTLDDIEHGILRSNSNMNMQLGDSRMKFIMDKPLDPRIHFTLNCGAKSCPPILVYTPELLDR